MVRTVLLHVGLHKTGTTSFQKFLAVNEARFAEAGVAIYRPVIAANERRVANEIAVAILRRGVFDDVPKMTLRDPDEPRIDVDKASWRARIAAHLDALSAEAPQDTLLVSGEDISFLRTREEAEALKALFPETVTRFRIFVTMRDVESWWASYSSMIERAGLPGSEHRNANRHLVKDGWLTDFETMITALEDVFGPVVRVPYQANTIPALLDAMEIAVDAETAVFERRSKKPARSPLRRLFGRA